MMTSAVPKLGAVVMMAFSMLFAASPSVASSTVAIPRTVSATSPCGSGPVTIPATHVPSSGLVEVDVGTHQRFHPIRVMPLDNPQAAIFAGGDLYVSYSPSGPESGFRVERIDPKTGVLARSQWFLGYSSPPVAAFGSIWVVAGTGCPYRIIRLSQETLAVTMRTPIPPTFSPPSLAADDGALWFLGASSARLARLNPHTGRFSTVLLPEMAPDSNVAWFASDPKSGLLYISVINQNVAHSQVTERFDPTTGSFFIVPTPPYELTRVLGVAGDILWVIQGGGMMTHFAPFSTASLAPVSCTRAVICALAGFNGAVDGSVEDGIFAFEHIGGPEGRHGSLLLDCIGGPRVSTVARLQLPSDFPIPGGSSLPSILLALGGGYLVTFARVGTDGGSGIAIFPLDPRCAP
jgi:hypothetical protein